MSVVGGKEWKLFVGCIAFRCVNVILVQTAFNPDEYWQSLEVAHRLVFGVGFLSWEWSAGIRGYVHPLIFGLLYKILWWCGMDSGWAVAYAPRYLQAVISGLGDVYLAKIANLLFGPQTARMTLLCQLTCWFNWFCSTRTLSSTMETSLTYIALYCYLSKSMNSTAFFAALTVVLRPTALLTWMCIVIYEVWQHQQIVGLKAYVSQGCFWMLVSTLVDRVCYGRFVVNMFEFVKFNLVQGGGSFYGSHPLHWYFTQGLPVMLFTYLVPLCYGVQSAVRKEGSVRRGVDVYVMLFCGVGVMCGLSFVGHKEFRFVFPVLGMLMPYCGLGMLKLRNKWKVLLVLCQIPLSVYFGLVHQRGSIDVVNWLRLNGQPGSSVLFLTPCHATPLHSHLHNMRFNITFLDCSPPGMDAATANINDINAILQLQEGSFVQHIWMTEQTKFMEKPVEILQEYLKKSQPQYIIVFENILFQILPLAKQEKYFEIVRFFHSHFPIDDVLLGNIVVLHRKNSIPIVSD